VASRDRSVGSDLPCRDHWILGPRRRLEHDGLEQWRLLWYAGVV